MDRMGELPDEQEVVLPPVKRVVLSGKPSEPAADVIVDYAKTDDMDFIVMDTHGCRGVRRLFLGSVSEKVLCSAHCPFMVVNTGDDREHWSVSA